MARHCRSSPGPAHRCRCNARYHRAMSQKYHFRVEVQPRFLPGQSSPEDGLYSFAYTITVTNAGSVAAQLIARHWTIVDAHGHVEEVKGLGVVGHQPLLRPGESFQYTSGCRLRTASGTKIGRAHV